MEDETVNKMADRAQVGAHWSGVGMSDERFVVGGHAQPDEGKNARRLGTSTIAMMWSIQH